MVRGLTCVFIGFGIGVIRIGLGLLCIELPSQEVLESPIVAVKVDDILERVILLVAFI